MAKRGGSDLRKWALVGAEQRLLHIAEEAAAIHRAFPELRRGSQKQRAPGALRTAGSEGAPRRRRRKMSAAARKRISDAQKARWAKQKAGKKS